MIDTLRKIGKSLHIFFISLFLAGGIGLSIALLSPHGVAAFTYSSFILGFFEGLIYVALYLLIVTLKKQSLSPTKGAYLGLFLGVSAFPMSTLIFEKSIYFPNDLYLLFLLIYLALVGLLIGWLLTKFILNHQS